MNRMWPVSEIKEDLTLASQDVCPDTKMFFIDCVRNGCECGLKNLPEDEIADAINEYVDWLDDQLRKPIPR